MNQNTQSLLAKKTSLWDAKQNCSVSSRNRCCRNPGQSEKYSGEPLYAWIITSMNQNTQSLLAKKTSLWDAKQNCSV
eukprot:c46643_g1_i1 orf=145-375(+)